MLNGTRFTNFVLCKLCCSYLQFPIRCKFNKNTNRNAITFFCLFSLCLQIISFVIGSLGVIIKIKLNFMYLEINWKEKIPFNNKSKKLFNQMCIKYVYIIRNKCEQARQKETRLDLYIYMYIMLIVNIQEHQK